MAKKGTLALTPEQVNSFPVSTKGYTIKGEKVAPQSPADPNAEFMQLARERFQVCADAEGTRREQMLMDLQFRCGDDANQFQWDGQVLRARLKKRRPSHTVNRIPEFTKHVVNNMRQSRPSIKIIPVGDGADEEQAEIRQGLIRHIEVTSQAPSAYDTAFEHMCIMGLGWIRVVDDWSDPESFDKDLFIRWVSNPFSVYTDPEASLPDWSDMQYAFVVKDYMPADFKARWGEAKAVSASNFKSIGDQQSNWNPGGKIRVAEYFHIEQENDTACQIDPLQGSDEQPKNSLLSELTKGVNKGKYVSEPDPDNANRGILMMVDGENLIPVGKTRKCTIPVVYWSLISGLDKLEERKWRGRYIPLIPVIGNQFDVDGEKIVTGMVRYARELQRLYNYIFSTLTEVVALTPKNQFIAEVDQLGEFRDFFERANIDPMSVLPYKMKVDDKGAAIPPPQRMSATVEISGLVQALQVVDNMIKSIFGIYDASLGQRGPQESGLAINARKIESDTSTYDWGDNFIRALVYLGRVVNDLLVPYYNIPGRLVQILREDQSSDTIVFNKEFIDKETKQPKKIDLDSGKYSVEVSTGPDYPTKRKEAADGMVNFFKLYPAGLQACAHILVKELDFPGKDAIAAQLEKILPPNLQDPKDGEGPDPMALQQQVAQLTQLTQALSEALKEATDKKELEHMKQMFETFRDDQKNQMGVIVQLLKQGSAEGLMMAEKDFEQAQIAAAATIPLMAEQPSSAVSPPAGGPPGAPPAGPAAPAQAPPGPQPSSAGPPTAGG